MYTMLMNGKSIYSLIFMTPARRHMPYSLIFAAADTHSFTFTSALDIFENEKTSLATL